jgi:hypothetical protein
MTLDAKLALMHLDGRIARLELRVERLLIHYQALDRHCLEARAARERIRIMLRNRRNYIRQRAELLRTAAPDVGQQNRRRVVQFSV